MKLFFLIAASLTSLLMLAPAQAHHGTFTFDNDQIVVLEGVITRFQWTNPHSSVYLEVINPDGSTREVDVEMDGPSLLRPLGIDRNSLNPGDKVIAYVSPRLDDNNQVYLGREIIKEDGSLVTLSVAFARDQENNDIPPTDTILTTWVPDQGNLFRFVPERATWPLTEAGASALAAYDVTAPFTQTACVPATSPTLMMYPTAKVFSDQDDYIELDADWMGASRQIWMDGREAPEGMTYLQGFSTGHWEGSTLVVETSHFSDNAHGNAFGIPSSEQKFLVERFILEADGEQLIYSFVLEDPQYLAQAVTSTYSWYHRPDIAASSVPCDPEAASRHLKN